MRISVLIGGSFFVFRDFAEIVSPQSEGLRYPGHYVRTGAWGWQPQQALCAEWVPVGIACQVTFHAFVSDDSLIAFL